MPGPTYVASVVLILVGVCFAVAVMLGLFASSAPTTAIAICGYVVCFFGAFIGAFIDETKHKVGRNFWDMVVHAFGITVAIAAPLLVLAFVVNLFV